MRMHGLISKWTFLYKQRQAIATPKETVFAWHEDVHRVLKFDQWKSVDPLCFIRDALVKFNLRSFRRFILLMYTLRGTDEISDRDKSRLSLNYDASWIHEERSESIVWPLNRDCGKQFACTPVRTKWLVGVTVVQSKRWNLIAQFFPFFVDGRIELFSEETATKNFHSSYPP